MPNERYNSGRGGAFGFVGFGRWFPMTVPRDCGTEYGST